MSLAHVSSKRAIVAHANRLLPAVPYSRLFSGHGSKLSMRQRTPEGPESRVANSYQFAQGTESLNAETLSPRHTGWLVTLRRSNVSGAGFTLGRTSRGVQTWVLPLLGDSSEARSQPPTQGCSLCHLSPPTSLPHSLTSGSVSEEPNLKHKAEELMNTGGVCRGCGAGRTERLSKPSELPVTCQGDSWHLGVSILSTPSPGL